jgi:hypothetical protein
MSKFLCILFLYRAGYIIHDHEGLLDKNRSPLLKRLPLPRFCETPPRRAEAETEPPAGKLSEKVGIFPGFCSLSNGASRSALMKKRKRARDVEIRKKTLFLL